VGKEIINAVEISLIKGTKTKLKRVLEKLIFFGILLFSASAIDNTGL
jgi:hypothetical protein